MAKTAFYGPRSRENARLLISTAQELGLHSHVVKTVTGGYLVPVEITDRINEGLDIQDETEQGGAEEGGVPGGTDTKRPSTADSKADWLAYAQATGLGVTDENTKAEIIEAVKAEEETD